MSASDLRPLLDNAYLLATAAATLFLAVQGWRREPDARPLALAMGILLLQAMYRVVASAAPALLGALGKGSLAPVVDRTLGMLFVILLAYGLVRPLFPVYRVPLYWLLGSHLAFLGGLAAVVAYDFGATWSPGTRFADHWGAVTYEGYLIPVLLAAMFTMLAVYRLSRSTYAAMVLVALSLWLVGHAVHLGGILAGQDAPVSWGNVLRLFEIAAVALVAVVLIVPDPGRRSLAARYRADAAALVRSLEVQVEQLTAAKAALEERQRLARELHDSVSQSLFSVELNASTVEALLEKDPAKARERLARLRAAAHEALGDLRALIAELHPPALEGKTVAQALTDYAAALQEREGLSVSVSADEQGDLEPEAQAELFRIGYEGLTNVVKHAQASHAWVDLRVRAPAFRLRIADDGIGLDAAATVGEARTFGLSGMRERAAILGAHLSIGQRPGGGTELVVER